MPHRVAAAVAPNAEVNVSISRTAPVGVSSTRPSADVDARPEDLLARHLQKPNHPDLRQLPTSSTFDPEAACAQATLF